MARFRHINGGEVEVRDDKVMDSSIWTPVEAKKAPAKKAAAKPEQK